MLSSLGDFSGLLICRASLVPLSGASRGLFRHVADRLDFEPAVHRGAPGLDARPRGQGFAAREIRAVDPIELLGVTLIAQPHDDLQQAIHVRAGRFHQPFHVVHHEAHLLGKGRIRERRNRTPLFPCLAHRPGKRLVERRQARNKNQVAVAHAQVEGRIRRGQAGVVIVLFHRLLPCAEWYDASGARATPVCDPGCCAADPFQVPER